jgi:ABC-2 type transport system permease protein
MPVMMVLLYGYALNMDIKHIPLAVIDHDKTPESRSIINGFNSSEYFDVKTYLSGTDEVQKLLKKRTIKAALVIPQGFSEDRKRKPESHIQLLVDGSDATYGSITINYTNLIITTHELEIALSHNLLPLDIRARFLYNPDLKGSHFIIPGLVAVILMMICALLTSITISREKETGTMDLLLVSPVHPAEIIIGKIIPYIIISLLDAIIVLFLAKLVFNIPLKGDLLLLLALSIVYIYTALGMGLLISSLAPTQQVAMMAALVATLLPSIILSGFIFPIFSMPAPIRAVTYLVPAKYYIEIIRGILLKSSSFATLKSQTLCLVILGSFFLTLATVRFKMRIK